MRELIDKSDPGKTPSGTAAGKARRTRILVTGGSGFIGRHLVCALAARGHFVRILDPAPAADLPPGTEHVCGSILDQANALRALDGIDCVYHIAGIAQLWSAERGQLDRVNRAGTESILRAAKQQKIRRFVHCSSDTVLLPPERPAGEIAETISLSLADMTGPYTRSKYLAERAALAACCEDMGVVVVNPTIPVGPGDCNFTPPTAMLARYLAGTAFYVDCVMNIVDVRDVARGMILAAERGRPGERYILGGENVSLERILSMLSRITGRKNIKIRVPSALALIAGVASEWVAAHLTHRVPLATVEGVRLALRSAPFDTSKARGELGFNPRPAEDAVRDAVAWLLSSGGARPPMTQIGSSPAAFEHETPQTAASTLRGAIKQG
jgi:hopanoid-associated sugar epimerase